MLPNGHLYYCCESTNFFSYDVFILVLLNMHSMEKHVLVVPGCCVAFTLLQAIWLLVYRFVKQKIFDPQKVLTLDECAPGFLLWFDLNRNATARINFPLEIPLFHLWASACNKSTDSPWWADSKSSPKLAQRCAAPEGSRKLLPHRQVCEPDPPESHYGSTFLFTELINKNSRSHTVLHCPNLHDVWGLWYTQALEVRSSVRAQRSMAKRMIQLSLKTSLCGKLRKYRRIQRSTADTLPEMCMYAGMETWSFHAATETLYVNEI